MPGGNVNITCVAVGSPMPYVKWMQGAEDLTPEDDMPVGRNVLELTDVKDSANYTCVAMSSLGVIEAVAQITVKCKGWEQGPGCTCGRGHVLGRMGAWPELCPSMSAGDTGHVSCWCMGAELGHVTRVGMAVVCACAICMGRACGCLTCTGDTGLHVQVLLYK